MDVLYFEKYSNILKKELTPLPEIYNQAKEIIQQYKNLLLIRTFWSDPNSDLSQTISHISLN